MCEHIIIQAEQYKVCKNCGLFIHYNELVYFSPDNLTDLYKRVLYKRITYLNI